MLINHFDGGVVTADSTQALAERLATDVANWLQEGIEQRGSATLIVSGGSTPAPFFTALSQINIPWNAVTVTLADERWVAVDDELSNEKLVRETLLVNAAASAQFLSMYNDAGSAEEGWQQCDDALREMPNPYDVVVLGMGGDGHTASLFPDTEGLTDACNPATEKLCWPMRPAHITEARMSLTLAALLDSRQLILHITGEDKRRVFEQAVASENLPIASVIEAAKAKLQLYWAA